MYLAYSLLLTLGLVVLFPYFLLKALVHGKYIAGLRQRLGTVPQVNGKPVIWLHCVSVGETQAARPLALRLKREFPNHALVVSTTTLTGQTLAREVLTSQRDSRNDERVMRKLLFQALRQRTRRLSLPN